jgi:hypothetical protein
MSGTVAAKVVQVVWDNVLLALLEFPVEVVAVLEVILVMVVQAALLQIQIQ